MTYKYQPGDRVFAKLKGYPPWPARVKERLPVKVETYKIYFYGTYEEANIKADQIFDYNEANILKYGKQLRKLRFKEAMEEIAENIEIREDDPLDVEEPETPMEQGEPIPVAGHLSDDGSEGNLLIDEGPPPPVLRRESRPPTLTPAAAPAPKVTPIGPPKMTPAPTLKGSLPRGTPGTNAKVTPGPSTKVNPTSIETVETSEAAATATPPTAKAGRRGSKGIVKKDLVGGTATPPPPAAETTPQPEIVSRSGRKIKPKRFADDELPLSAAAIAKGDEGRGSDGPPPAKRTRRNASTGAAGVTPVAPPKPALVPAPVPAPKLTEKPKVTPTLAVATTTRGRTRQSTEPSVAAAIPAGQAPPVPTLRARPGISPAVAAPTRSKAQSTGPARPAETTKTARQVAAQAAATRTRLSRGGVESRAPATATDGGQEEQDGSSPISGRESGAATPAGSNDLDKENNENSLSAEEGQWLNGEPVDSDEVEDGEGYEEGSGADDNSEAGSTRRVPVMAKNGADIEIIYDEDRPDEFKNEVARVEWDLGTARNVLKIRTELEKDEFAATNFLSAVAEAVEIKEVELKDYISVRTKEKVALKINQLRMEGEMIEIIGEIVGCLSLKASDCDRAIELLERLESQTLNKLLLKKHPEVTQTVERLRHYTGAPDLWNFNAEERAELSAKTAIIRDKATGIFVRFKQLFYTTNDEQFMEIFRQDVAAFNGAVAHLTDKGMLGLVTDPTESEKVAVKKPSGIKNSDTIPVPEEMELETSSGEVETQKAEVEENKINESAKVEETQEETPQTIPIPV